MIMGILDFIRSRHINSFQKLQVLLLLARYPTFRGTIEQYAERLFLGDVPLIEKTIEEMFAAGLLEYSNKTWWLPDDGLLQFSLQYLYHTYQDPLDRQVILNAVRSNDYRHPQ
jgi:hypothetical protein